MKKLKAGETKIEKKPKQTARNSIKELSAKKAIAVYGMFAITRA